MIFRDGLSKQLLDAALRASPDAGNVRHLQRLALHRNFGTTDEHRALLIHDYADALRHYSEFVVYLTCKYFWESHDDEWRPTIPKMRMICEAIHSEFRERQSKLLGKPTHQPKPVRRQADRTDDTHRIDLCKFLTEKGEPDYLGMTHTHSTYYLESIAASKFGWKKTEP